ncbi:hypothetical protein GPECTOR_4g890 [Gonium pectorale]|uniref:Uncharacterized protein n=1 Tax=Gonium pectorale TaxID=33097 RepID=A0A150GYA3_GONPE|nr:hypothetical protein GPECTOR_4g890 [Gonium pectorale]|eukprot:KXZ54819.1 hypothetical protein GPECTOR_4g890 [Gonium pectorale]
MQQNDLLPGQQAVGRVFAVPASSSDCFPYSFEALRACRPDRTFPPDTIYDSCDTRPISRDADGCPKLAGYTFYRGWLLSDAPNWRVDDGTQWGLVEGGADAKASAAHDMQLMAARCSAQPSCAAFQSIGDSADLLYQLPLPASWERAPASADFCTGIYAKTPQPAACPRIPGYLLTPLMTLDVNASAAAGGAAAGFAPAVGAVPCADCADAAALAVRCDGYTGSGGSCAGFSNYHGLILGTAGRLLTDAPLVPFTSTPCAGLYTRASRVFPSEVEELDRLLCGDAVYCTSQLRYQAVGQSAASAGSSSGSYYVDVSIEVLTDLALPRGLLDPTSGGGLRPLPSLRSLSFRCRDGATLLGGLPLGVVALMPVLQELRVVGCGLGGPLPADLAMLPYLRVLDLSANRFQGPLPKAWGGLSLGYLNLSSNLLSGTLPPSWRRVVSPPWASPPSSVPDQALTPASPPLPPPREWASSMLVADLSANSLEGAIPKDYVHAACVRKELRMQLRGQPRAELMEVLGGGALPTFLLHYNPGVAAWAGRYAFAAADLGGGRQNLCGADRYKISLGVIWGVFGGCLLAVIGYSIVAAVREGRLRQRSGHVFRGPGFGFMTEADFVRGLHSHEAGNDTDSDADGNGADAGSDTSGQRGGCGRASTSTGGGVGGLQRLAVLVDRLWARRWVRRVALLTRVCYLAADVALDIRVTVWLFADGDASASAVCLAFIVVTQAAVSAALWGSLAHHLFSSKLMVAAVYPVLLAVGPALGPLLAFANIRNPDVPIVFWRYLELVEFCVALLQAPAEAVTQSVVYARQNLMGGGMYVDHGLFLTSILLSMGDMLIAAWKLCRYKRGPLRRVLVAVTHLDKSGAAVAAATAPSA